MLNEQEIREMIPPNDLTENIKLQVPSYLIQALDEDNYLIHRELMNNEFENYQNHQIFEHKGKVYLWCVINCPSEESAVTAISSYWSAFLQLKNFN